MVSKLVVPNENHQDKAAQFSPWGNDLVWIEGIFSSWYFSIDSLWVGNYIPTILDLKGRYTGLERCQSVPKKVCIQG